LGNKKGEVNAEYKNKFTEYINDDFNTSGALSALQEVLKSDLSAEDKLATILDFDRVLGLSFNKVLEKIPEVKLNEDVAALLKQREKARAEKNWPESDRLRAEIEKLGFRINDSAGGTEVYKN
jgi:cysteinyl-tRNA synthetase